MSYFSGKVTKVRFSNAGTSFYVMDMALDSGKVSTVRGVVVGIPVHVGTWFGFEAKLENHPTYGQQLAIEKAPILQNGTGQQGVWDPQTALQVLSNHGVAPRICEVIFNRFKEDTIEVLGDETKLQEIEGITSFTAQYIVSRWQTVRSTFQTLHFLGDLGVPKTKLDQIYAHFGDRAEGVLSVNPWALVQIDGITFQQADEVARRLSVNNLENRLRGAILSTCKGRRGLGHLYMTSGELVRGASEFIGDFDKGIFAQVLKQMHKESLIVIDNKTQEGTTAIYEPWSYALENEGSRLLVERVSSASLYGEGLAVYRKNLGMVGVRSKDLAEDSSLPIDQLIKGVVEEWSENGQLKLSGEQMRGVVNALLEPVSIVTGLPGTGKTTLLKIVVKILKDCMVNFLLVAPTGIAAKRMAGVTGSEASTIHKAFDARGFCDDTNREATYSGIVGESAGIEDEDGSSGSWNYSEKNPHPAQVLICDESSMVDQHLLFRLLSCTSNKCRLVFVGDAAQLPSVGPGNVLRDLIESRKFPVVNLQEIFRQEEASEIIMASHAIHKGEVPKYTKNSKEFVFLDVKSENTVLDSLLQLVQSLYDRRMNFQVLSPRHAGTLGVTNLNIRIRDTLNPHGSGREMRIGSETIREEDRVMVAKNNYFYGIFNGDVGKVQRLDQGEKKIEVKIHGSPSLQVRLPLKEAVSLIRLAYAITVHKSQGQEYDVIVLPWVSSFRQQLQRNLLYTAVTRARKKVILIGHSDALATAVHNNREDARNTLFKERIFNWISMSESLKLGME